MHKLFYWLFLAKIKMATCLPEQSHSGFLKGNREHKINKIGQLPPNISESSGLISAGNGRTFFTHNDGGNQPQIFEIDSSGKVLATTEIPNSINTDWEDITRDSQNNLYIGDFGNNTNTRQNLNIIKFSADGSTQKLNFQLADQHTFPPKKSEQNYDLEAFFWANDSLYLFSKNRGKKQTKLYKMAAQNGNNMLLPVNTIYLKANITGAAISPKASQFALLSYGKIFIFGIKNRAINFENPLFCIKASLKQAEAITYLTETEILITNEQGEIFKLSLANPIRN